MGKTIQILAIGLVAVALASGPAAGAAPQKLTLTMRDFGFSPKAVTLQAGVPAEITLVNRGKVQHEFMLYAFPKRPLNSMMGHEWVEDTNYFHGMNATVEGGKFTSKEGFLFEVLVRPGQTVAVKFTPTKKGRFEFGCMVKGHYENGQRGTLTVK